MSGKESVFIDKEKLIILYSEGLNYRQLASIFKCGRETIRAKMIKYKIPARPSRMLKGYRYPVGHPSVKQKRIHNGYMQSYKPDYLFSNKDGYIPEHRYIMEQKIGRKLSDKEVVHHIDGNKLNNVLENLLVTTKELHSKHHSEIKYGRKGVL